MKRISIQAPAPKPGPEVKKLHADLGHWAYEGEAKPGPGCLGGKFTGEMTCQMILGGFFLQGRLSGKVAESEMHVLEIAGYDPVNKNFSGDYYYGDGSKHSGALTITGNKWTYAGKWSVAGRQYQLKYSFVFAPDLTSATEKADLFSGTATRFYRL